MTSGAFERHIREAIELNRRRAPLYAEASEGVSLPLSRALIWRERLLLPFARWIDRRAERYRRAGIPLMDELFVSMDDAAPFLPLVAVEPPRGAPPDPRIIAGRLREAFRRGGFSSAADLLDRELDRLAADTAYWCMSRHMLESARRICSVGPEHVERSLSVGLPSPEPIHRLLFRLHLVGLSSAHRLDARAYPLQRRGIPILCRDLPPIPPRP
jgi:hypothetical protein